MNKANRKYKDTLFAKLFGDPRHKAEILEVYNALNGTAYTDPENIEVLKLDDCFFLGREDDSSFLLGTELDLWEEQSSYCPNMPLRGLGYFARLYEKYVALHGLNMYGTKALRLPTPKYVVFYIGNEKRGDCELRFSNLVHNSKESAVEVVTKMVDITYDEGKELLKKSSTLRGYSYLVCRIRTLWSEGLTLELAISDAIRECIGKGILMPFLQENREVAAMTLFGEMSDEEVELIKYQAGFEEGREEGRQQGREEGREQGREEGREELLFEFVKDGLCSLETAASKLGLTAEAFALKMESRKAETSRKGASV